ncbi:MAG: hypothetical protein LBV00_11985 [Propionibacteriaceae bacterium]|jgi:hypothetical protein|nr:hypothetical protein [Propionibacteriaceae bacterium]
MIKHVPPSEGRPAWPFIIGSQGVDDDPDAQSTLAGRASVDSDIVPWM